MKQTIFTAFLILVFIQVVAGASKEHVVEYGESLWRISKRHYGDGRKWCRIYKANLDRVRNPDHIRPGMKLRIPPAKGKIEVPVPKGYEYWKTVRAKCTAYEPSWRCCAPYADGKTSTGRNAWRMDGCGVYPKAIPYGTMINIPGIGYRRADDAGPAMRRSWKKGIYHIDIRMRSYRKARKWGVKWKTVRLYRKKKQ